jgi:two-component system KDP operon response regulator KdpE
MESKVVVVELNRNNEENITYTVKIECPEHTFSVVSGTKNTSDSVEALNADVVIIDANTADSTALELVKQIRLSSEVPLVILSDSKAEMDRVQSLEAGADDYISKPINVLDLLIRLRAVLRRIFLSYYDEIKLPPIETDDMVIDFDSRHISVKGETVHLTPTEFKLLGVLAQNEGKFLDQENLRFRVWGSADFVDTSAIKKYIRRLRIKLGDDTKSPKMIISERGVGYKFVCPART